MPLHGGLWGTTWETPTLNRVLCPARLLRAGAARKSSSLGEQVPVPAHLHPRGDGQMEPMAIHAPLGWDVLKPGVLFPDGQQGPSTQHVPHSVSLRLLPHRASAPTAPPGQTPQLQPLRWRKDPLLPPDRAFLLQPAWGLLNRRRKTHCDFKQTQRTYRIWRETIFSSAAQSPH